MALRIPRGYAVNRPYFREVSEGVRPNSQAAPRLPHTGLAHVRVDEVHHDPIVIDAGTIIGGGPNAFQKYESGDVLVSKAVASALLLLDDHPEGLSVLKSREADRHVAA